MYYGSFAVRILYSNTNIFYSNTKNLFLIEKYKSVDFIMFFKILIIFITLTQYLKTKKNIIVLENSFFVLENIKKSKKIKKIIFFYKIKKNIDFTI